MRIIFLPLRISFTPVMESRAGMPALSGSKGGLTFAGVLFFFFFRDAILDFLRTERPKKASWFECDLRYRVHFPDRRNATLQALWSWMLTGGVSHIKEQRSFNVYRNRRIVKVIGCAR